MIKRIICDFIIKVKKIIKLHLTKKTYKKYKIYNFVYFTNN